MAEHVCATAHCSLIHNRKLQTVCGLLDWQRHYMSCSAWRSFLHSMCSKSSFELSKLLPEVQCVSSDVRMLAASAILIVCSFVTQDSSKLTPVHARFTHCAHPDALCVCRVPAHSTQIPRTACSLLQAGPSLGLGTPEVGADPDVQCTRPPKELPLLLLRDCLAPPSLHHTYSHSAHAAQ